MSTRAHERQAVDEIMASNETKEAARLLSAAGFRELPGIRTDGRVGFRTIGDYYELVIQFTDGHMEAIRQTIDGPLWFPGHDEPHHLEWMKSGEPLDVVQELLALPS
ncbi:MAG: hypothetical protein ACRDSL_08125 [Pseudonocardiaceae bacterium]